MLAAQANGVLLLVGAIAHRHRGGPPAGEPANHRRGACSSIGVAGLARQRRERVRRGARRAREPQPAGRALASRVGRARLARGRSSPRSDALVFDAERLDSIASIVRSRCSSSSRRGGCSATRLGSCSKRSPHRYRRRGRACRARRAAEGSRRCIICTCGPRAPNTPALSAHVVLTGPLSLHDAQERAIELKAMLAERFGIQHATLEVECHACIEDHVHALPPNRRATHHDH